ncbi:MAG: Crp/Fnr family transcriptional regulator [Chitinophagaceae bacterium]
MEQIRQYFEQICTLSNKDWELFSSKLDKQLLPKKHLLLKQGQTENYLSFVEKGTIRFFIPNEENDVTFAFAFAGNFASSYDSFLTQNPTTYCVETLSETILWRISYANLQQIYNDTEVGNRIGRFASEELFLKKSKRELSLLTHTAEQRYLNLFKEQAHVLQLIPLKYIASYIGITPQALSRIRKRIS